MLRLKTWIIVFISFAFLAIALVIWFGATLSLSQTVEDNLGKLSRDLAIHDPGMSFDYHQLDVSTYWGAPKITILNALIDVRDNEKLYRLEAPEINIMGSLWNHNKVTAVLPKDVQLTITGRNRDAEIIRLNADRSVEVNLYKYKKGEGGQKTNFINFFSFPKGYKVTLNLLNKTDEKQSEVIIPIVGNDNYYSAFPPYSQWLTPKLETIQNKASK